MFIGAAFVVVFSLPVVAQQPAAADLQRWESRYRASGAARDEKKQVLADAYKQVFEWLPGIKWMAERLFLWETDALMIEEISTNFGYLQRTAGAREYLFSLALELPARQFQHKMALLRALRTYEGVKSQVLDPIMQRNKDVRVLIEAIRAFGDIATLLSTSEKAEAINTLENALQDPQWQIQVAAVQALTRFGVIAVDPREQRRIFDTLVNALSDTNQLRLKVEIAGALDDLLRMPRPQQSLSPKEVARRLEREYWTACLAWDQGPRLQGQPLKLPEAISARHEFPVIFGMPVPSDQVVFLIDVSESMNTAIPAARKAALLLDLPHLAEQTAAIRSMADLVRAELAACLDSMPKKTRFALAFFAEEVQFFNRTMERASDQSRRAALRALQTKPAGGLTALEQAIHGGFRFSRRAGEEVPDPFDPTHFREGPDTMVIITDGYNTVGAAVTQDERPDLVARIDQINRYRQIRLCAVSLPGADEWLLRALCDKSRGQLRRFE